MQALLGTHWPVVSGLALSPGTSEACRALRASAGIYHTSYQERARRASLRTLAQPVVRARAWEPLILLIAGFRPPTRQLPLQVNE